MVIETLHSKRISELRKAMWRDPIIRNKIVSKLRGRKDTEETRNKKRIAKSGKKLSEEHKRKLRGRRKHRGETPYDVKVKLVERKYGGFWYGAVRYYDVEYCEKFTENLRERCRAYFEYKCFECGESQGKRKLSVHHIHYNKKTCCDGSPSDIIPLCQSCHAKTHFNRDYWENRFATILYSTDKPGKCFFTKDEMKRFNTNKL